MDGKFLGGYALRLRVLHLDGITFPALALLRHLLSASDLVDLQLHGRVPSTEYISPEALVTGLSAMAQLKTLRLPFVPGTLPGTFHSERLGTDIPSPSLERIVFFLDSYQLFFPWHKWISRKPLYNQCLFSRVCTYNTEAACSRRRILLLSHLIFALSLPTKPATSDPRTSSSDRIDSPGY